MNRQKLLKLIVVALLLINVPATSFGKWTELTPPTTKGRWGAMTFVLNGTIYMGGGYVGNFQNLNDLISYNPSTDKWTNLAGLPYVFGGRTAGVSFVIDGKAYVGLGAEYYNNFNPTPRYLADIWEYDPTGDTWTQKANFPVAGVSDAAVFVVNNKAYIVGGSEGSTQSDKTFEYDPATETWTEKAAYPGGGIRMGKGFALGDKGYVVGGEISGSATNKLYQYDPATDKWSTKKTYPTPIWSAVAIVVNNKAYIGLGAEDAIGSSTKYSNQFFEYNPELDNWAYWGSSELDAARMHSASAAVDGKAYVGSGWKLDGTSQIFYNDWYALDPTSVVGITENNLTANIEVHPNPATDKLYVTTRGKNFNYTLYSITGSIITQGELSDRKNLINTSDIPSGNYILKLSTVEFSVNKMVSIN